MKKMMVAIGVAGIVLGAAARQVSLDLTGKSGGTVRRAAFATAAAPTDARVVREHYLAAGSASVTDLAVGDKLIFQLFADKEITVTLTYEMNALQGKSFLGKVEGDDGFDTVVVLETADGLVLDVTDPLNRRVWQVTSNASGVTVRELTPADRPANACGTEAFMARKAADTTTYTDSGYPLSSTDMPYESMSGRIVNIGQTAVRVLVCFDQNAQSYVASKNTTVEDFAQKSVDKMNAALMNTHVDAEKQHPLLEYFRFELAGVMKVPNSPKGDLEKVIDAIDGENPGVWNGYDWRNVRKQRAAVNADIATVLCYNSATTEGTVGIGSSLMKDGPTDCGYNACLINFVDQDHTMTHECGHNMGAGHENTLQPAGNGGPQYYSYSSGYYFQANITKQDGSTENGVWCHTIMAYDADKNEKSYPVEAPGFSSPRDTFFGTTIGTVAKNDNTRTLYQTFATVAQNHSRSASGGSSVAARTKSGKKVRWSSGSGARYVADAEDCGLDDFDDEEEEGEDDDECLALDPESWIGLELTNSVVHADEDDADLDFWYAMPLAGTLKVLAGDATVTNIVVSAADVEADWMADGDYDWENVALPLPVGQYELQFVYDCDTSVSSNGVCYLDEITFAEDVDFPDEYTETNSVVTAAVPYSWIDEHYPEDWDNYIDPDDRVRKVGANGYKVWQSYVADLDPTNATSKFEATITMTNGVPKIEWTPKSAARTYTVYGKESLTNDWTNLGSDPTDEERNKYHFFKVGVEIR